MARKINIVDQINYVNDVTVRTTEDVFRDSFGSWKMSDDGKDLQYFTNENAYFSLRQPDSVEFDLVPKNIIVDANQQDIDKVTATNNKIVSPTTADGSVPFAERLFRQTFYIAKNINTGASILQYLKYNKRFTNLAFEYEMPNFTTDGQDERVNQNDKKIKFDFIYQVENQNYEEFIKTLNDIGQVPSFTEFLNFKNDNPMEPVLSLLKNKANTTLIGVDGSRAKNLLVTPESLDGVEGYLEGKNDLTLSEGTPIILKEHIALGENTTALNPPLEIPFLTRMTFPKIPKIQNKFITNNLMFFYNELSKKGVGTSLFSCYDPQFDLSTTLMRWHKTFIDILDENKKYVHAEQNTSSDNFYPLTSLNISSQLKTYDLIEWVNRYAPALLGDVGLDDMEIFGLLDESYALSNSNLSNSFVLRFAVTKLLQAFCGGNLDRNQEENSDIETYNPVYSSLYTFENLLNCGGKGVSEVLFYKIDKYEGTSTNGTPVQSYFIPAGNGLDKESFLVDTQVFYNTDYSYVVNQVTAVMSMEYEYVEMPQLQNVVGKNEFLFCVKQYPRIKIIEIPVANKTSRIIGDPPMVPDFSLLQIRRRKNKVRFYFKSNGGNSKEPMPYKALTTDDSINKANLVSQGRYGNSNIMFSDISSINKFHIFVSDYDPLLYNIDPYLFFNNNLYSTIEVDTDLNTQLKADSGAIELSLILNKKYYFCFVSENKLGLLSNPTDILEVEMVEDSGLTYLRYKALNIDLTNSNELSFEKNTRKETKTCRKLVRIVPSIGQTLINSGMYNMELQDSNASSKNKDVYIGNTEDNMFPVGQVSKGVQTGKKFKFRFISKKTSKMFDINVTCKHERIRSAHDSSAYLAIRPTQVPFPSDGVNPFDVLAGDRIYFKQLPYPRTFCSPTTSGDKLEIADIIPLINRSSSGLTAQENQDLLLGGTSGLNGGVVRTLTEQVDSDPASVPAFVGKDTISLSQIGRADFYPR